DVMQVSDITKVLGPKTFERPIYAGNAIQTVEATDPKIVVTVRTASFAATGQGGSAPIEPVAAAADPGVSSFVGEALAKSDRPELTSARIIISGGRAMQKAENFKTYIEPIADKLGAAMGATRAAVDAGYAPNDSQIIVAINKDEEAPIFQVADYGLVADLYTALPELNAELAKIGR